MFFHHFLLQVLLVYFVLDPLKSLPFLVFSVYFLVQFCLHLFVRGLKYFLRALFYFLLVELVVVFLLTPTLSFLSSSYSVLLSLNSSQFLLSLNLFVNFFLVLGHSLELLKFLCNRLLTDRFYRKYCLHRVESGLCVVNIFKVLGWWLL